jgi:hypothetical protein
MSVRAKSGGANDSAETAIRIVRRLASHDHVIAEHPRVVVERPALSAHADACRIGENSTIGFSMRYLARRGVTDWMVWDREKRCPAHFAGRKLLKLPKDEAMRLGGSKDNGLQLGLILAQPVWRLRARHERTRAPTISTNSYSLSRSRKARQHIVNFLLRLDGES